MYNVPKKKLIFIIFLLILLPSASAVLLESGTTLNTSISNSSMTFLGCSVTTDEALVETTRITLTNNSFSPPFNLFNFPDPIIWEDENKNIDCGDFDIEFGTNKTCTAQNVSIFALIILMSALAILVFVSGFILFKVKNQKPISAKEILVIFIGLILGVVLITSIADSLNSICSL